MLVYSSLRRTTIVQSIYIFAMFSSLYKIYCRIFQNYKKIPVSSGILSKLTGIFPRELLNQRTALQRASDVSHATCRSTGTQKV